jgi:transposase
MEQGDRRRAKLRIVDGLRHGLPCREALILGDVPISERTAYRALKVVRAVGETGLEDGRHGHPYKLAGAVRQWLVEYCRGAPGTSSRVVQAEIDDRFGVSVSISQINRTRRALGISSQGAGGENRPCNGQNTVEGAGYLLLLAAAQQTGLIDALGAVLPEDLPADNGGRHHNNPDSRRALLPTLLLLPAVGLRRTHDLRGYTGDALALLSGRTQAYSYRHTERFLSAVAKAGGAVTLTDALADWTAKLWRPRLLPVQEPRPAYYVDGHRKAVYSDKLIPRGLVSQYGKVLGCRALMLLHDEHGHPLLATTHRGDTHPTAGLPPLVVRYERAAGHAGVCRLVVDREGMSSEFLAQLGREGRDVVTILRGNQYQGESSFTDIGEFAPLCRDRHGDVTREVAPARYSLSLPDNPDKRLNVRVALVRDLRRRVPLAPEGGDASRPECYPDSPSWFDANWVAAPAPKVPTEHALVPIVTTADDLDAVELAKVYAHRWRVQENVIRDWLLPLGLDTNHGYAKAPVPNSEVEKKRAALEKRRDNAKRWGEKAMLASLRAQKTSDRRWKRAKARSREAYSELNGRLFAMEREGLSPREYRAHEKELVTAVEEEMEGYWHSYYRAHDRGSREYDKWQKYCQQQRALLRELEVTNAGERRMYELDDRKDHVMTVLKLALCNLAMWARDHYFPPGYEHATWRRLVPFLRLPGRVEWGEDSVKVVLEAFNDRALNRDLSMVGSRLADSSSHLPGGRRLLVTVDGVETQRAVARHKRAA